MNGVEGFMYPNEVRPAVERADRPLPLHHGVGGGRFHSGVARTHPSNVEAVKPTYYRLALLHRAGLPSGGAAAVAVALGPSGALAGDVLHAPRHLKPWRLFGFVYLWYLMAVLVFEIWLDYRRDIVLLSQSSTGLLRRLYRIMTLGSRTSARDRSPSTARSAGSSPWSAFRLPSSCTDTSASSSAPSRPTPGGNSPLMPVVFIFSAMVSGIAAVMLLYMLTTKLRRQPIDMPCVDTIAMYSSTSSSSTSAWRCWI